MDGDGEMYSARFIRVDAEANTLTVVARYTKVNEGGVVPDERNSVAPGPEDWISFDATYRWVLGTSWIEGGVGADHRNQKWANDQDVVGRAWLRWSRPFR
jgi:hypothetical protein